jgi:uncharacterized membrane protein
MLNKLQICNVITNLSIMNLKRIFGAVLTILGIIALIYAAYTFANTATASQNVKVTVIYGIIGLIFFVSGIGLIKTTKDEA